MANEKNIFWSKKERTDIFRQMIPALFQYGVTQAQSKKKPDRQTKREINNYETKQLGLEKIEFKLLQFIQPERKKNQITQTQFSR